MAPARCRRAWYSRKMSAIFRSKITCARSAYASAETWSFLAALIVACTDRGGNRFGSRSRSRIT